MLFGTLLHLLNAPALICNQQVAGSNPTTGSSNIKALWVFTRRALFAFVALVSPKRLIPSYTLLPALIRAASFRAADSC